MRRVLSLLVLGLISLLAGPLAADQVVLKDGRTLDTKKPPEIRGRQAILVLPDGKLVSIPASEIDAEKTAALAKKAAETVRPAGTPVPASAPTLAGAAQATRDAKKATVVLTDQDVAGGFLEPEAEKKGAGTGRVVVSNVAAKKTANGTSVTGSVQNTGSGAVEGVSLTVEAVGEKGETVASTFGALSADRLAAGEKATFRAFLADASVTAANVRAVPKWRSAQKEAEEPGKAPAEGKQAAAKGEAPPPEPSPTPAPTAPPEQPTPRPRPPDMAAPPANAPVGAPSQPGGTYVPQPSSDQPKPPGGGV
ncbi:MAG: FxLYD domain-containing protein [Thermoanaerobaculia bacterium]